MIRDKFYAVHAQDEKLNIILSLLKENFSSFYERKFQKWNAFTTSWVEEK